MTIDGFLTFCTLIVAIYAVIPNVSRRAIEIKFGILTWVIAWVTLFLILILEVYEPIHDVLRVPSFGLSRYGIRPQNVAFAILVAVSIYIGLTIRYGSIPHRRLNKLQQLIDASIEAGMFADLIDKVLAPNLTWICSISRDQSAKPRDVAIASDIVRIAFTSPRFVDFIATSKPYFALTMLRQDVFAVHEFTTLYFRKLIENPQSILYFEIKNNQNISTRDGYDFPQRNRLLYFLFGDARTAERLSVWGPVGEFLLLGSASPDLEENRKVLNQPMRDFKETGRWSHPLSVGIWFFDLMVSAALVQNVRWHMWLWYSPTSPNGSPMRLIPTRLTWKPTPNGRLSGIS